MGIIYEIVCNETGERYIGSSDETITERIYRHENTLLYPYQNKCSSIEIIKRQNYTYKILEQVENKDNLFQRERYWFDILPNINMRSPCGRLITQSQKAKKWRENTSPYYCSICNINISISNKSRHIKLKHS